jgi:hypothetical protein
VLYKQLRDPNRPVLRLDRCHSAMLWIELRCHRNVDPTLDLFDMGTLSNPSDYFFDRPFTKCRTANKEILECETPRISFERRQILKWPLNADPPIGGINAGGDSFERAVCFRAQFEQAPLSGSAWTAELFGLGPQENDVAADLDELSLIGDACCATDVNALWVLNAVISEQSYVADDQPRLCVLVHDIYVARERCARIRQSLYRTNRLLNRLRPPHVERKIEMRWIQRLYDVHSPAFIALSIAPS